MIYPRPSCHGAVELTAGNPGQGFRKQRDSPAGIVQKARPGHTEMPWGRAKVTASSSHKILPPVQLPCGKDAKGFSIDVTCSPVPTTSLTKGLDCKLYAGRAHLDVSIIPYCDVQYFVLVGT